jgi:hypothetical protein
MNTLNLKNCGHSADVQIQLSVNGHVLSVTKIGPEFLVVREPIDHPPAEAEIALWIDGHESRWRVRLVEGIARERRKTPIARCP